MSKKIAVTGGIGSGKSSVLKILREMNYPVFSCDEIYADLRESAGYLQKLSEIFPESVVNGQIDKKRLAEIVFNNPDQRKKLNELSHPMIMQKLNDLMDACNEPLVFAEVPLLFENGFEKNFDGVIVVMRDINERVSAVCQRDDLTIQQAQRRICSQFNYDDSENQTYLTSIRCHFIQNDGTKTNLIKKTVDVLKNL